VAAETAFQVWTADSQETGGGRENPQYIDRIDHNGSMQDKILQIGLFCAINDADDTYTCGR
jgi:hypothetical protein